MTEPVHAPPRHKVLITPDDRDLVRRAVKPGPAPPSAASAAVPPAVARTIASPGQALDPGARAAMEARFGRDFGEVRVHTDQQAAESARAVHARAYTVGQHIAFDSAEYQPDTPAGRQLLAHELAHTVQQRGLQTAAFAGGISAEGSPYELEAERAARSATAPVVTGRPATPLICRAANAKPATNPKAAAKPKPADQGPESDDSGAGRVWEPVKKSDPLSRLGVTERSKTRSDVPPAIRAYNVGAFQVPVEKGPVLKYWETRAKGGGLDSFIDADGTARAALKQERPDTDTLRRFWMTRVGLQTSAEAAEAWTAAGGDKAATFEPRIGGVIADMDHIIELQLGGNNIPENIQVLEKAENQKSGRDIFAELKEKAQAIRDLEPGVQTVILHFDSVKQAPATSSKAYKIEQKILAEHGRAATKEDRADEGTEPYQVVAAVPTEFDIPAGLRKPKADKTVPLAESPYRRTKAASTLIPGMILDELRLRAGDADRIDASIDTGNEKTRLPITVRKQKGAIELTVEKDRSLKLTKRTTNIAFTYPYLSEGAITRLDMDPDRGLSGEG